MAEHPDWKLGAPELLICVRSDDPAWGWAIAEVTARLRGQCPFCIGEIIDFRERISEGSRMSAFLIYFPFGLERDATKLDLPAPAVNFVGMYPIYKGEIDLIGRIGQLAFCNTAGFDPFDVQRRDLSLDC